MHFFVETLSVGALRRQWVLLQSSAAPLQAQRYHVLWQTCCPEVLCCTQQRPRGQKGSLSHDTSEAVRSLQPAASLSAELFLFGPSSDLPDSLVRSHCLQQYRAVHYSVPGQVLFTAVSNTMLCACTPQSRSTEPRPRSLSSSSEHACVHDADLEWRGALSANRQ